MTPRTAHNAMVAPLDRAELDRVVDAARRRGYSDGALGFTPQPRHITPWAHCLPLVARWAWGRLVDRVAPFPPRSRLQRHLTRRLVGRRPVTARLVGRWCGRLDRRMARLEGMGR